MFKFVKNSSIATIVADLSKVDLSEVSRFVDLMVPHNFSKVEHRLDDNSVLTLVFVRD